LATRRGAGAIWGKVIAWCLPDLRVAVTSIQGDGRSLNVPPLAGRAGLFRSISNFDEKALDLSRGLDYIANSN
jgi:hypothetical protein